MNPAVLFTVVAASILLVRVDSSSKSNIQNFLQALQQQLQQEQRQQQKSQQLYSYKDDSDSYYGSLKNRDLDRIFSLSSQLEKQQRDSKKNRRKKQQDEQYYVLRRPFTQGMKLVPNDLLGLGGNRDSTSSSESYNREDDVNQNEYSKVYVILNSEAIRKSKNKDKLNALLSSLLDAPPQQSRNEYENQIHRHQDKEKRNWEDFYRNRYFQLANNRYQDEDDRYQDQQKRGYRGQNKDRRYKGFLLNNDDLDDSVLRRKMPRGSGESMAEPRPKPPMRQREARDRPRRGRDRGGGGGGGGGGSGGGHTAIPYIRQHGDIYERED